MKISIQELQGQIRRGPGLVFGPGMSTAPGREVECLKQLKSLHPDLDIDCPCSSFLDYVDLVSAAGTASETKLRNDVQSAFTNAAFANPQLDAITKANWTVIVSLGCDDFLRTKMMDALYATPSKWTLTTIAEPDTTPSLTSVPYYALMGDIRDNRDLSSLAISRSQYLRRQRQWARMLQSLPSIIKNDPLIFLGTATIVERVCDFMNELLKLQPQVPRKLIFLETDPTATNATFRNLVRPFSEIITAECSLSDLCNALSKTNLDIRSLPLFAEPTKGLIDPKVFAEIEDQVAYVPRKDEVRANAAERNRLQDSLFRPTHLDWAPYALGLEFVRDVCSDIEVLVTKFLRTPQAERSPVLQLKGEAGIGKTVIMRTVAFALAQQSKLCVWVKRSYGEVSGHRFDSVVTTLNEAIRRRNTEVIVFLDDPIGNRTQLNEIIISLGKAKFAWLIIVASRKTDETIPVKDGLAQPIPDENIVEVSPEFSNSELERLPDYLVTLGVAENVERAKQMMLAPGVKHSRDVLCSLWYLLPSTQSAIEESLVGEYRRLGETETLIKSFAKAASASKSVAKAAYEFVTTASGFDSVPLPVEVLVSALGISYGEWAENCCERKPLWGLLYEDSYPSAETYAYRTRNHIVTEVLLRTLNHGTAGHTGEFRCLKRLLSACSSTSPQYRTFILDILVERRHLIERRFNYQQAMELYDAAVSAYPKPLGVVEHHRCLAKRKLGGDCQEVYDELRRLIARSQDHTVADQDQADNLHTSAAAALNQMIKEKRVDAADGGETVFEHVSAALEIDQFSLHSHHVHAQTLLTVAAAVRGTNRGAFWTNIERAARIVGRALLLVAHSSPDGQISEQTAQSTKMFQDLRQDILMAQPDLDIIRGQSFEAFKKTGDQTPLAFVARILLTKATQDKRGSLFKKTDEFLRDCFKLINDASKDPRDELLLCRVELIVEWLLNRDRGPVSWEQFESDLYHILRNPRFARDTLWLFYLGVAQYNRGKFVEAEASFQALRSRNLPWDRRQKVRCLYLGEQAAPKIFEGKLSPGAHDNRFVYSAELENDILVRRGSLTGRMDEVKHFKIGFTLYGPLAIGRDEAT
ncbi:MAG: hypothetical protein JNN07_22365 [Verrucomicrobiales bacterium]|nr:hypothetical protein [Verrucomicrobiales bacterium]